MGESQRKMESWGTRIGVIMAVMGSAVGLGNFLRFPGLAAQYEGGAFMIPYFVAMLVLGLPIAWAEWAMGRFGGRCGYNSSPGIYRSISRSRIAGLFGVLGVLIPIIIFMYYIVIESWCLSYAWFYLSGKMAEVGAAARTGGALPDKAPYIALFKQFTGSGANGSLFSSGGAEALGFLAFCFTINLIIIYRGISKGIEKFCMWAMPALIICALIVLVRVLTLHDISSGLGFMWNARTPGAQSFAHSLTNPRMWLAASGQIFFTLSVGFGIIVTYASYLKPNDDIALSSLTSCAGNEFCEVALGGMITIPAAFLFLGAQQVTEAAGSSFNLGFNTLPMIFESMRFGYIAGFAFFFLLFLAAITSSLSMLQPAIALLEEGLGMNRKASVAMLGLITALGSGFVLYFSQGTIALDTFDFWGGTLFIYVLATFQTILFGWVMGIERGMAEIDRGAEIRIPRVVGFMLKYISPTYLLIVLGFWLYNEITNPTDNRFRQIVESPAVALSVGFIVVVFIFLVLLVSQSIKRWERMERRVGEVQV